MKISDRIKQTLAAIDQLNQQDPTSVMINGKEVAKEHLYALRMSQWLEKFQPEASEHLQIACRAQHLQRWIIPRSDFPMNVQGYKRWRTQLATYHADTTAGIMASCGYEDSDIQRVKNILQKKNLRLDEESQALEDVACLVFLNFYIDDFVAKHEPEKVIDIIRKTWSKMSPEGQQAALKISFSDSTSRLLTSALSNK